MIRATAILITKDNSYPQEVLSSLPDFDEVLIYTNCPNIFGRYTLALKAKNDLIYVQDDDCIVEDIELLYAHYDGTITNFMQGSHTELYRGTGITLIGWGAIFPKHLIEFSRYTNRYGMDEHFLREADRVFTFLNQPQNTIFGTIKNLDSASDGSRMWRADDHFQRLEKIIQKCFDLNATTFSNLSLPFLVRRCTFLRSKNWFQESYDLSLTAPMLSFHPLNFDADQEWMLLEEHGLAAYYLGKKDEAREYFLRVASYSLPPADRERTEMNLSFCPPPTVVV